MFLDSFVLGLLDNCYVVILTQEVLKFIRRLRNCSEEIKTHRSAMPELQSQSRAAYKTALLKQFKQLKILQKLECCGIDCLVL